ncbi:MAG: alpha-L-arabinofuranosidase C-terminal domain-containing protein [bacterium]
MEARITVEAGRVVGRVSPFIFGHFIEAIRDLMPAMSAEILRCRDFELEDLNGDGVADGWFPILGPGGTRFRLDPAARGHSGHSQRITIRSRDGYGGVAQRGLPIEKDRSYIFKICCRATGEIGKLKVSLRGTDGDDYASKEVGGIGHRWRDHLIRLVPTKSDREAILEITISADGALWDDGRLALGGTLWIDRVSLVPEDSVCGVKREVAELTRALKPGMLRFPGGCFADVYHWEDGVGPLDERPNTPNEHWGGVESNDFGTDEFIQFCREIGAEPLICLNFGSGTPEEAAAWVEYCNGAPDTKYGNLRARNGHPDPYNVRYWEVGNEIYGVHEVGHCSPGEYAKRYLEFHRAIKEADPDAKVLACGSVSRDWNETVIKLAGESMDYLTIHFYTPTVPPEQVGGPEEFYYTVVAAPERLRAIIEDTRRIIESEERFRHIKLAFTEWNTMYHPWARRRGFPREHTLESAVANAATMNEFIRNSDITGMAHFSDLVNGWVGGCIRVGDFFADQPEAEPPGWSGAPSNLVYGTPTYHALKLYATQPGRVLVDTLVECGAFDARGITDMWRNRALARLPYIDAVSLLSEDSYKLAILAVNRHYGDGVPTRIIVRDFPVEGGAKIYRISGDSPDSANHPSDPYEIGIEEDELAVDGGEFSYVFPPHSITGLIFSKR